MDPIPGVPVFRWCHAPDATGTINLRVLTAQFGDGYQQSTGDGIHNVVQSWPLQFLGRPQRLQPIAEFLRERAGWQAFHWTPPDGELGLYVCTQYTLRHINARTRALAATFQQVFRP